MNGFLVVLKPPGMTSSDVVVRVRRQLGRKEKVGHAGTLDPEASGILPLMIGKAARLFDYLVEKEKTYIAELKPGYATDTQDAHGKIVSGTGEKVTREALEAVLPQFIGDIMQVPPMFSALKRDGQKLCDLARQGIDVELEARPTQVYEIEILHALENGGFMLRIRCGKGTYIRTLCHDIGQALGTGAHMGLLLRTQTGMFTLQDAHTIEEIEACGDLSSMLVEMDRPLGHVPRVDVMPHAERFVRNGNALTKRELRGELIEGRPVRLYLNDQFAGIGRMHGDQMKFDAMLLE